MRPSLVMLALSAWPQTGQGLELSLPGNAVMSREVQLEAESYRVPIGPFADGALPVLDVDGTFRQQAWRLEQQALTTLQMIAPLRTQLLEAGYDILLECNGPVCGGFDFRFATRVMDAPHMFVDLFDYRFLSARLEREEGPPSYVSVLASRTGSAGYIQLIQLGPAALSVEPGGAVFDSISRWSSDAPLMDVLIAQGHVILPDLSFASGSSALGEGPFASLDALAALLLDNPDLRVALVGHTDTVGALDANIALSKRRASSVRERLVQAYGVPGEQLDAEGMGYLSPIAPNLDQAGREANRRVEAVLLNVE